MCGIAGFINADHEPADRDVLQRMTCTLHRRGPDGQGIWTDQIAALGHRRLSIIDIAGGTQPMSNEDGTIWVTFNGEIYNEPDLRKRLVAAGHKFQTNSDTECLVHLYEDHGPDFVKFLNGMFALAIWDIPNRRLLLARDRMGQKPLYWHLSDHGTFIFASEPKAMLEHPEFSGTLDASKLAEYLFFEYLPYESSIWKGLKKLRAGHSLIFENRMVRLHRYWEPPSASHSELIGESSGLKNLPQEFWSRFLSSVARHQRSDVPLGVFLSGGVDSSAVAAAIVELQGRDRVQTFSIGFDESSFDESDHARLVARHLGTQHHERIFRVESLTELLPNLCDWLDEPFGDASVLPTHLLCKFAREEVTVALGGDGADELMAGYPTFTAEPWFKRFQHLPGPVQRLVQAGVNHLPVKHSNFSFDFKAKQFMRGVGAEPALAHQRWLGSFSQAEIARTLITPPEIDLEQAYMERLSQEWPDDASEVDRRLLQYQSTYLAEDILFKVDRASMATSLEVRAPFLDAELVDWLAGLPYEVKRQGSVGKLLLKKALQRRIPDSIMNRPKKGFGIPVASWLRGPLKAWMTDLLSPARIKDQSLFQVHEINRLVDEHLQGIRDHRKPLWTLLIFQIWYDRWAQHRRDSADNHPVSLRS